MRIASLSVACAGAVLAASLVLAHPPGHGQPKAPAQPTELPGTGRNLQVLPADIDQEELLSLMDDWRRALGVQCSYCHVPGNFRSDANPHKNIARGMVKMTIDINEKLLPPVVGASQEPGVTCYTCHQGEAKPDTAPPTPVRQPAPPTPAEQPKLNPDLHVAPDTPARPY